MDRGRLVTGKKPSTTGLAGKDYVGSYCFIFASCVKQSADERSCSVVAHGKAKQTAREKKLVGKLAKTNERNSDSTSTYAFPVSSNEQTGICQNPAVQERATLLVDIATLFLSATSFWRRSISHFSEQDVALAILKHVALAILKDVALAILKKA